MRLATVVAICVAALAVASADAPSLGASPIGIGMRPGALVARIALQAVGIPYLWGGMSALGVDCSGLVVFVFRPFARLPHSTWLLWRLGRWVPRPRIAPGDLLFFNTDGSGPSHVGIAVGRLLFAHASLSRGRVVLSSLAEPYFSSRYIGTRRLL